MLTLKSKNIIVTGATSGIGRETALVLNALEANLFLIGRNEEALSQLKMDMPHQTVIANDISNLGNIVQLFKGIAKESNGIDGVVHAAGLHEVTPLRTVTIEQTEKILKTNVESTIQILKACSNKRIMNNSGSIVLLSSSSGLVGEPGIIAYSASKGAIISITKAASLELATNNIRVNCIAPGVVKTPMSEKFKESIGNEKWLEIEKKHPLGIGKPIDIAYPIAFLLSDHSTWITGVTLPIDGGYTA